MSQNPATRTGMKLKKADGTNQKCKGPIKLLNLVFFFKDVFGSFCYYQPNSRFIPGFQRFVLFRWYFLQKDSGVAKCPI